MHSYHWWFKLTFPNDETVLIIILALSVCNGTGEWPFAVFKCSKNYLRSSLGDYHLQNVSIMFIENYVAQNLNVENIQWTLCITATSH